MKSKRKQPRGYFFLDSQMSLLVYPYSNTFNMAVMQFWKQRNYFGVLGEQSFIVKKNNCFFMPRGLLGSRMIVSDLILCWNIAVSGMGCLWDQMPAPSYSHSSSRPPFLHRLLSPSPPTPSLMSPHSLAEKLPVPSTLYRSHTCSSSFFLTSFFSKGFICCCKKCRDLC